MTMEENLEITQKKRFRYGLLLAWVPLLFFIVPTAIGIIRGIAQVSSEKATGLAVVTGGVAEVAATFGLLVIVASEVVGIVMLVRTSSRNHTIRTVVAIASVVCSGLLRCVNSRFVGKPETIQKRAWGRLLPASLSAVSEAPTSEDLSFRCAVKGRL